MKAAGKAVTYGSICEVVDFSYTSFEEDLLDLKAVNDVITRLLCQQRLLADEEDILLTKIEVAIDQLTEMGEAVGWEAVLQILGSDTGYLNLFPRIKALLRHIPTKHYVEPQRVESHTVLPTT